MSIGFNEALEILHEAEGDQIKVYNAIFLGSEQYDLADKIGIGMNALSDNVHKYADGWTVEEREYLDMRVKALRAITLMVRQRATNQRQWVNDLLGIFKTNEGESDAP